MRTLTCTIQPLSAFGGSVRGDTLFGQLCWAVRHHYGEQRLVSLLAGYTDGEPFAVVSDAIPAGYLPRPAIPQAWFEQPADADRKRLKKQVWLPREHYSLPVRQWLSACRTEAEIAAGRSEGKLWQSHPQPHNSINRATGTTGRGFDPYQEDQFWPAPDVQWQLYIAYDDSVLSVDEISQLLSEIGQSGYGKNASIGLGRYRVVACDEDDWPGHEDTKSYLTLAPLAPQGLNLDVNRCYYQPFTRFGKHGDVLVHGANPFKTPVLLADTAAVLTFKDDQKRMFAGQGIGGDGQLSHALPQTVQQGYAPVLPIRWSEDDE